MNGKKICLFCAGAGICLVHQGLAPLANERDNLSLIIKNPTAIYQFGNDKNKADLLSSVNRQGGGSRMLYVIANSASTATGSIQTSVVSGLVIPTSAENLPLATLLPRNNLWPIYSEQSQIKKDGNKDATGFL